MSACTSGVRGDIAACAVSQYMLVLENALVLCLALFCTAKAQVLEGAAKIFSGCILVVFGIMCFIALAPQ
jgi:hypothetical protein